MTPDEIIEVMQGVKAGRKWQYYVAIDDAQVTPDDQSVGHLFYRAVGEYPIRLAPLPDEITIPARVIPAPLREAPKVGTLVWSADPTQSTFSGAFTWNGGEWAVRQLERGFVYMEQKPSEQAGEAMCHYA